MKESLKNREVEFKTVREIFGSPYRKVYYRMKPKKWWEKIFRDECRWKVLAVTGCSLFTWYEYENIMPNIKTYGDAIAAINEYEHQYEKVVEDSVERQWKRLGVE